MSQLWLRTVVVDPTTKTILRRLPQHPLPENLRVSQLRSYLEQRFVPPLAEHVAGESWMEFENSYPFAMAVRLSIAFKASAESWLMGPQLAR